ncbi:MAG: DUF1611 domain-containing protein [Ignavibacteriales bacterium]|nr:DUF1611 domain-containing protein [Ignavibacteriales bacterium]
MISDIFHTPSSHRRILILAEEKFSPLRSKTANGAIAYLDEEVVAIIDSTKAGTTSQQVLGYGGNIPVVASLEEGLHFSPTHLLIGIAPPGGRLPESWRNMIASALQSGLHILNGLHTILSDDASFAELARAHGAAITDWRKIDPNHEVVSKGNWKNRRAKTILAVGSDCNIGKMTTMLGIHREFLARKLRSDFIGTGQTGIMISGKGVCVDSVIGDYIAGSIEKEIDRSDAAGYDYIFVEGQGALTHQGYSSVTLGLMHGTMPDAMILCHQPTRVRDDYGIPLRELRRLIRFHEEAIDLFRPTKVVGIGINSIGLTDEESMAAAKKIENETGLPTIDTFRFGGAVLADALLRYFGIVGARKAL